MSATDAVTGSAHPPPGPPVRESTQGTWFRLPDGTPGSRVRLPAGAEAASVRRVRRLGLPGLLPVAAVLEHDDRIWVDTPLLDLGMRLGEGTGALLALPVVLGAARALQDVATFDAAGVVDKTDG